MAEQHGPGGEDATKREWHWRGPGRPVLTGDDPLGGEHVNGFDLGGETPVDLGAVRADDALLDALGGGNPEVNPALAGHELSARARVSGGEDCDLMPFTYQFLG